MGRRKKGGKNCQKKFSEKDNDMSCSEMAFCNGNKFQQNCNACKKADINLSEEFGNTCENENKNAKTRVNKNLNNDGIVCDPVEDYCKKLEDYLEAGNLNSELSKEICQKTVKDANFKRYPKLNEFDHSYATLDPYSLPVNLDSELSKGMNQEIHCDAYFETYSKPNKFDNSNKAKNMQIQKIEDTDTNLKLKNPVNYKGVKPKIQVHYSQNENFVENSPGRSMKPKQIIEKSMKSYEKLTDSFLQSFYRWKRERENTLTKLKELSADLHKNQKAFNAARYICKNVSYQSRCVKSCLTSNVNAQTTDFLASLSALVSDTVNGITSAAQAYNIDSYENLFQEIMEHDAEITKSLYAARSMCVEKYKNVEEIVRNHHSDTFNSTVEKISDILEMDRFWLDIKHQEGNGFQSVSNAVSHFIDRNCKPQIIGEVYDSVQNYVGKNPAALEAVKSAGKAIYGVIDTWGSEKGKQTSNVNPVFKKCSNLSFMLDDERELGRLQLTLQENGPQTSLEAKIEDAIEALEAEMNEISSMVLSMRAPCRQTANSAFYD